MPIRKTTTTEEPCTPHLLAPGGRRALKQSQCQGVVKVRLVQQSCELNRKMEGL